MGCRAETLDTRGRVDGDFNDAEGCRLVAMVVVGVRLGALDSFDDWKAERRGVCSRMTECVLDSTATDQEAATTPTLRGLMRTPFATANTAMLSTS
jgi:hypothetical protein